MKVNPRKESGRRLRRPPKIKSDASSEWLGSLAEKVSYVGSEAHKKDSGNFGVGARPRPDATLCDEVRIDDKAVAESLLKAGIEAGLVSEQMENGYPKRVWSVQGDLVFEARLQNEETGEYHGYPLLKEVDEVRNSILAHVAKNHEQQLRISN